MPGRVRCASVVGIAGCESGTPKGAARFQTGHDYNGWPSEVRERLHEASLGDGLRDNGVIGAEEEPAGFRLELGRDQSAVASSQSGFLSAWSAISVQMVVIGVCGFQPHVRSARLESSTSQGTSNGRSLASAATS